MNRSGAKMLAHRQEDDYSCSIESLRYVLSVHLKRKRVELQMPDRFIPDPEIGMDNDQFAELLGKYLHTEVVMPGEIYQIIEAVRDRMLVIVNIQICEKRGETPGGYYATVLDAWNAEGHFAVVRGYHNGHFIMYDPLLGDGLKIKPDNFLQRWKASYSNHDHWMAIVHGIKDAANNALW